MVDRKVTRIEPLDTLPGIQKMLLHKKVAAYIRVSTDSDEQLNSFEAQRDYYEKYITANPNWEFAGIYSDEGISGVNTKLRDGFNNMVADALDGKIDLIITKSLSRFARNTVDALKTIRALKEKNKEVYFEKEDIHTLDAKGELLITLMSSLAQEESRSLSENVTWGVRKRFADGKYHIVYKGFLGYKAGKNGAPAIDETEAAIIRFMYLRFLEGWTCGDIARKLEKSDIKTVRGKSHWRPGTIASILTNEKYYGAALLQKKYTADYLTKKMVKNDGVLPQYLVENGHPAIISKELFEEVQKKMNSTTFSVSKRTPFNEQIICESCGTFYGRNKWSRIDGIYSWVWECPQKYKELKCNNPHAYEDLIFEGYCDVTKHLFSVYKDTLTEYMKKLTVVIDETMLFKEFDTFLKSVPKEEFYDKSTWLIMTRKVIITKDRKLKFEFISGRKHTYALPEKVRKQQVPLYGTKPISHKEWKMSVEKHISLKDKIDDLTDDDKTNIAIMKLRGNGYKRIAALLNMNRETVKSILHRNRDNNDFFEIEGYCRRCGDKLGHSPGKKRKIFCSDACRTKWQNVHKKESKAFIKQKCLYCGAEFISYKENQQKYCSRKCYNNSRKKTEVKKEVKDDKTTPKHRLTDDDKKTISMYTRQGLGYRSIARMTGLNANTLKSLLRRHKDDPFYYPPKDCCLYCGVPLSQTPRKRAKKYCSNACRMKWWREHNAEVNKKAFYKLTCKQCGKEFESYGNANRIYCSRECFADARRANKISQTERFL